VRATRIASDASGSTFAVGDLELRSPLPGRFNVLNVLGAVAAARALGVGDETIAAALPGAARAPGRFEPVDEGQPFAVLIDYAHTPDSLENVLLAARPLTGGALNAGRVIVVFGAGGDRDRAKRPLMGAVACDLADVVIVTSDNPRNEDPEAIIAAILGGAGAGVEVEVDRRAAIERAIGIAEPDDVVVIAGKGHEQGQEFEDGRKVPFDDVSVAREALRARLVA
jgi:UDP-N-acetylmuramoyl-L-alanyl-D-glutamate--2,6-diaminopimelate ligase